MEVMTAYHAIPVSAYKVKASGELRPATLAATQATVLTRKIAADATSICRNTDDGTPASTVPMLLAGAPAPARTESLPAYRKPSTLPRYPSRQSCSCGSARSVARSSVAGSVATKLVSRRLGITSASGHVDLSASPMGSYQVAPTERRQRSGRPSRLAVIASSLDAGRIAPRP